jgi:hypothetical protein
MMLTRPFLAVALILCASSNFSHAQNLLANPGFEEPITFDGLPYVGSWEGFNSGVGTFVENNFGMPRSGVQHLLLRIEEKDTSFAGVFQDVPVTAGTEYVFSGWHMTPSNPFDARMEVRIEWLSETTEIARTPNLTVIPTDSYMAFSLSGFAPIGSVFARVLYDIHTFGSEPTNSGTVFRGRYVFRRCARALGAWVTRCGGAAPYAQIGSAAAPAVKWTAKQLAEQVIRGQP